MVTEQSGASLEKGRGARPHRTLYLFGDQPTPNPLDAGKRVGSRNVPLHSIRIRVARPSVSQSLRSNPAHDFDHREYGQDSGTNAVNSDY
ncbi:hypothetical protein BH23ACT6_BH23ACT6_04190 [soil metagenome]